MAVTINELLQARHLVSLLVAGGNPNSSGVITFAGSTDIASAGGIKTFHALRFNSRSVLEMIKPSDQLWANYQVAGYDADVVVSEKIPANGAGALATLTQQYDFMSVIGLYRQRGASSGGIYVGFWGVVEPLESGIGDAAPNVASVTVRPAGAGIYIGTTLPVH